MHCKISCSACGDAGHCPIYREIGSPLTVSRNIIPTVVSIKKDVFKELEIKSLIKGVLKWQREE
jgi:L-lactate utilization protein LutB